MTALKKNLYKILTFATFAVLIYMMAVAIWPKVSRPSDQAREDPLPFRSKVNAESLAGAQGGQHREVNENARDRALLELKKKWGDYFALKKEGGDKKELGRLNWELAVESASRLLTSRQALELLAFLDDKNAKSEAITLRLRIKDLFKSGRTDDLVGPLVESITQTFDSAEDQYASDMLRWSFLLGENGSAEDAEQFKKGVDGPWPLGDFLHGWNMSRAGDDPLGSYTSMVEFLKNGGEGARQGQALENVINSFPEDGEFDYEALESILPTGVKGPDAEVYKKARRGLLTRWAKEEPANAVNYIIEHPERVPVDLVTAVVRQAITDFNHDGIEWVKGFPEGIYYDRAAVAVVQKLWDSHPTEAREWAKSIGDEKIRLTQLKNIESMNKQGSRR